MMHLTVAISTLATRVNRLSLDMLPAADGVDYHVFIQGLADPGQKPDMLQRADVKVTMLKSYGVAHSRNAAIESAGGDIILFADDDLSLHTDNYQRLRDVFLYYPDVDFVCAQLHSTEGQLLKTYPPDMTRASRFNTGRVGTPEMALRAKTIRKSGIRFDVNFGAGSTNWLGDEYIFLCDAMRAGLKGRHVSLVLASHPASSSGQDNSASSFAVRSKVLRRALGVTSWPMRCAYAWRHRKRFPDWSSILDFIKP